MFNDHSWANELVVNNRFNMHSRENIERLRTNLLSFIGLIDEFGRDMMNDGRRLNVAQRYYNTYLRRTWLNLEGIVHMLDGYVNNHQLIHSIAQIMRSLLTDFITSYYLLSFYNRNHENYASFENEMKLIDRDAYRSVLEWMKVEEDLHNYNENLPEIGEEEKRRRERQIREYFSDVIDDDFKPLTTEIIRGTSLDDFFFPEDDRRKPHRLVSENYKIQRLKKFDQFKMLDGYMLYKYFSQFYHESRLFDLIIRNDGANSNFSYLLWGFVPIYHMVDNAIRVFTNGESVYSERIGELKLELEAIYNS